MKRCGFSKSVANTRRPTWVRRCACAASRGREHGHSILTIPTPYRCCASVSPSASATCLFLRQMVRIVQQQVRAGCEQGVVSVLSDLGHCSHHCSVRHILIYRDGGCPQESWLGHGVWLRLVPRKPGSKLSSIPEPSLFQRAARSPQEWQTPAPNTLASWLLLDAASWPKSLSLTLCMCSLRGLCKTCR